jgi:chromosome segregation protein
MYLKEIVTSGFKSFADKLDIKLDDEITCIVGPNGSGKSNVVDAVRWVLGEQSIKSLRGENSMSDVIFSGSKSRNPLNVASVELIFDNKDHFINVPYTEISIKRRVYRTGENEYYLNGDRCRLKDITNLLLDTGMGKESFNIISQGEVDRILSNSPTDRRVIFEEAAGVLKYKKRKEEALRKLDRTHNNIDRVNDIIMELENQVEPLKEQSKKAKEYLENKEGLDHYEVALLAYDLENTNIDLERLRLEKEKLEKEIVTLSSESSKSDADEIEQKTKQEKLEKESLIIQQRLLEVTQAVEKVNGEKKLLQEKNKNANANANANAEENKVQEELRKSLEEKKNLESKLEKLKKELEIIITDSKKEQQQEQEITKELAKNKEKKTMLMQEFSSLERNLITEEHKINSLKREIEEGGDLPNSVRKVLTASTLTGIDNTIGNILNTKEEYVKALNIAISANKNFIITKDEYSAKQAINYLKDNHLGRATFFPLTVIKSRYIDEESKHRLEEDQDFIGILSDLVSYDKKYQNIIENQLGTIIIAKDLDSATNLSKKVNRRYKVVSLDGDVINVGGSLSGGSIYHTKSIVMLKQELKRLLDQKELREQEQHEIREELAKIEQEKESIEDQEFIISKRKVEKKEQYDKKQQEIKETKELLEEENKNYEALNAISNNSLNVKEQELIEEYHSLNTEKETLQLTLETTRKEIEEIKRKTEERQAEQKLKNASLRKEEQSLHEKEVTINRLEIKMDTMLETLNSEYELTFEKAKNNYHLDIEPEEARRKVNTYRANIKRIGMVNLAAIEEYERVNTRYEFLRKQKEDLENAENTLLEIMNEMDEVIKEEFKTTFEQIREEFRQVFKELFGGGNADLKLTDPNNLLTTGVEIVASPPGKKLTTISLLSGGEKTLTAISLLFAILNVRTVPFCLFDEVEAALDEANVGRFGKYLDHYKNKTQFLIITHKKKTMEYAKTLYGITMQESGVSKLVSVKLNQAIESL